MSVVRKWQWALVQRVGNRAEKFFREKIFWKNCLKNFFSCQEIEKIFSRWESAEKKLVLALWPGESQQNIGRRRRHFGKNCRAIQRRRRWSAQIYTITKQKGCISGGMRCAWQGKSQPVAFQSSQIKWIGHTDLLPHHFNVPCWRPLTTQGHLKWTLQRPLHARLSGKCCRM